jgi:hypothetical protein
MRTVVRLAVFGGLCCALAVGCEGSSTGMKTTPGTKSVKVVGHTGKDGDKQPPTPPAPPANPGK